MHHKFVAVGHVLTLTRKTSGGVGDGVGEISPERQQRRQFWSEGDREHKLWHQNLVAVGHVKVLTENDDDVTGLPTSQH